MTIKEFARLCGCNPQTLRYYDRMELLKPVRVDPWSGYRFYEKEQAIAFVKIKNLQKAGFTIEEIKGLLEEDNRVIFQAFETKIAEAQERLQEIKRIQQSYQTEMSDIQKKIQEVREKIMDSMRRYDPAEEFGIGPEEYAGIMENVNSAFASLAENVPKDIGYQEFSDGDAPEEEADYLDLLHNPSFTLLYENHGWAHVKDFFEEICDLEDGAEYALLFRVDPARNVYNEAFGNTILGMLLARNPDKRKSLTCNMEDSQDGQNHFWLLKQR